MRTFVKKDEIKPDSKQHHFHKQIISIEENIKDYLSIGCMVTEAKSLTTWIDLAACHHYTDKSLHFRIQDKVYSHRVGTSFNGYCPILSSNIPRPPAFHSGRCLC